MFNDSNHYIRHGSDYRLWQIHTKKESFFHLCDAMPNCILYYVYGSFKIYFHQFKCCSTVFSLLLLLISYQKMAAINGIEKNNKVEDEEEEEAHKLINQVGHVICFLFSCSTHYFTRIWTYICVCQTNAQANHNSRISYKP